MGSKFYYDCRTCDAKLEVEEDVPGSCYSCGEKYTWDFDCAHDDAVYIPVFENIIEQKREQKQFLMSKSRVTICMPCFGRPIRTKRAVECILAQTVTDYEAYIIGDGCPDFQRMLDTGWFDEKIKQAREKGSVLIASNMPIHAGGYGFEIRNRVKELAESEYFLYLDNDDIIDENHLEHYLSQIEDTDYDLVYFDTMVDAANYKRISELKEGMIGHSELMMRTDFLKRMPPHHNEYGHDWKLIDNMINAGAKIKKSDSGLATYHVMSLPNIRETNID